MAETTAPYPNSVLHLLRPALHAAEEGQAPKIQLEDSIESDFLVISIARELGLPSRQESIVDEAFALTRQMSRELARARVVGSIAAADAVMSQNWREVLDPPLQTVALPALAKIVTASRLPGLFGQSRRQDRLHLEDTVPEFLRDAYALDVFADSYCWPYGPSLQLALYYSPAEVVALRVAHPDIALGVFLETLDTMRTSSRPELHRALQDINRSS